MGSEDSGGSAASHTNAWCDQQGICIQPSYSSCTCCLVFVGHSSSVILQLDKYGRSIISLIHVINYVSVFSTDSLAYWVM